MEFSKIECLGNDYIIINNLNKDKEILKRNKQELIRISDQHYGIGSDGIIFIDEINNSKIKITIYNNDGNFIKTSGNGICSVVKYLYDKKIINQEEVFVETLSGINKVNLNIKNNEIKNLIINMGKPNFEPKKVPVLTDKNIFFNEEIEYLNKKYKATSISIGNPHTVIYENYINSLKLNEIGPELIFNYRFPERTNIEFVELKDKNNIKIRIWGRENKELLSCSSAACAAVIVGVLNNLLNIEEDINVYQTGGKMVVKYKQNEEVLVSENANIVYEGKYFVKKHKKC